MELYDVYKKTGTEMHGVTLEQAAIASGAAEDEIAWAVEEAGLCDMEDAVVVPHGAPKPGIDAG